MRKPAVDKERKKLETLPAWQFDKVKSKKEVILKAPGKKENPLCYIDGQLSSRECGFGTKSTETESPR